MPSERGLPTHTTSWLGVRQATWIVAVTCLLTLMLSWWVRRDPDHHPHFKVEHWWGFFCGLSFLSGLVLVVLSKLWQFVVRRPEDYYGE